MSKKIGASLSMPLKLSQYEISKIEFWMEVEIEEGKTVTPEAVQELQDTVRATVLAEMNRILEMHNPKPAF